MQDDIKAIREHISEIKQDIAAIKVDVHHHIKRSDAHEGQIERLKWWLIGILVGLVGYLASLLK